MLTVAQQQLAGPEDDPYQTRRRTLVPGAVVNASFKFLDDQYSRFIEWYKVELKYGHKWFVMYLSSAAGEVPHVVRFTKPPEGVMHGHRHWDVTAIIEVRERIFDNSLKLTSRPYPIDVTEYISVAATGPSLKTYKFKPEDMQLSGSIESVILKTTIHRHDAYEAMQLSATVQSIELREPRVTVTMPQEELQLSSTVQSIVIDEVRVSVSRTEELQLSATVQNIVLS